MRTRSQTEPEIAAADPPAAVAGDPPAHVLTITAADAGRRFDAALARALPQYSRSRLKAWIDAGRVRLDGRVADPTRKVFGGEQAVVLPAPEERETALSPEPIALAIVYEDDALLVLDKPAGLVVHPGAGNRAGTLQNALLHHAPKQAAVPRAGIVHRLDKDTSGLMVVAKTIPAHTSLVRALAARTVKREYLAVAAGDLVRGGTVDAPIGRHPTRRTSMAVVATGRPARTHVDVVERYGIATLVACRLETGRTHQIRVHLASLGHPLVGDPAYGKRSPVPFARQALHAARLGLVHPVTGKALLFTAPPPADFTALVERLRESGTALRRVATKVPRPRRER